MKKICLVLVSFLMIISTSVFAVGFHDDSEGKISTISEALKMKDDSYVTIQGNIEKKLSSDKYLFRDSTGTMTVEIDEDVFIELLWERVNETKWGSKYSEDFWTECFDYLSEIGWMKDPWDNNPSFIVDNIGVNGEICEKDECADNYDAINDDYEGDVDEWIDDNGYLVFDDYVVINLGL